MISELHIQGLRRFADYRIRDLARINLLVGDNNCGKTTVLEALHLFGLGNAHAALTLAAQRRGELLFRAEVGTGGSTEWYPTLRHSFTRHVIGPGSTVRVSSERSAYVVEVINIKTVPATYWIGRFRDFGVRSQWSDDRPSVTYFPIDRDGAFDSMTFGAANEDDRSSGRVQFLDFEFPSIHVRSLWDSINEQGLDAEVINALRVVKNDIQRIHFDAVQAPTFNPRVGIKFRDSASRELLPIGVLGGGMYRMLELALALVWCKDGMFLIDEIDTGLHWSIMGDLWKLVTEAAVKHNTQVFATTHSFDCLKGLAWLCENSPKLSTEVSVQTIHAKLDESVPLPGEQLPLAVEQQIEVR